MLSLSKHSKPDSKLSHSVKTLAPVSIQQKHIVNNSTMTVKILTDDDFTKLALLVMFQFYLPILDNMEKLSKTE